MLIISNILMNAGDIGALWGGPEEYPVFKVVDFSNYYIASKMLQEKKGGIYDPNLFTPYAEKMGRKDLNPILINYPPIHYTLMIPISMPDYNIAWNIWLLMNLFFLAASCFLLILIFLSKSKIITKIFAFLILFTYSLFSAPNIDNMGQGQVNTTLLFLLSVCIYLYTVLKYSKWRFLSGIPLGISIALKGLPAPAALYFLIKRDWKTLGTVVATQIFFTILPGLIFGPDILRSYAAVKSRFFFFDGGIADTSSYGFWKFIFRNSVSIPQIMYALSFILLTGISIWIISKNKTAVSPAYEIAFLIALIPLISPFSWSHHHVMNIIPITAVFCALWKLQAPDKIAYSALIAITAVSFILGTSDAAFLPFYLYAEKVKNHQTIQGFMGIPYIFLKAFFRDYRMLFLSNLCLWGIQFYFMKSKITNIQMNGNGETISPPENSV